MTSNIHLIEYLLILKLKNDPLKSRLNMQLNIVSPDNQLQRLYALFIV